MHLDSRYCRHVWASVVFMLSATGTPMLSWKLGAQTPTGVTVEPSAEPAKVGLGSTAPLPSAGRQNVPTEPPGTNDTKPRKLREGELYRAVGRFTRAADRVAFTTLDGSETFPVLENLALERVIRLLEEFPGADQSRPWEIAARVTEFRGMNYLLLVRVALKRWEPDSTEQPKP